MAGPLQKESWIDPSQRAGNVLDYIIDDDSPEALARKATQVPISQELSGEQVVRFSSNRARSRVLFITRDTSVLEADSMTTARFKELCDVFDEIHVIVLSYEGVKQNQSKRYQKNLFVYAMHIKSWFFISQHIQTLAKQQLEFAGGFRPDVIVALDPFECGVAGLTLAQAYGRPFQVHILQNIFDPAFLTQDERNKKRLSLLKTVLQHTQSVRVNTEALRSQIEQRYSNITDIGILPRYFDIRTILSTPDSHALKEKYPQYAFIALFVGELNHESTLYRAIDAARATLISPHIALVVLGDGPAKKEFQKRAEMLGVAQQVIFESDMSKLITYLKSADLLICPDTNQRSDEVVAQAAAAGLPILASHTQMRDDLFSDGTSAYLCVPNDTVEFSQKLTKFLNGNALRTQFSKNAQDIIKSRLHEDPEVYRRSYRDSIEVVFAGMQIDHSNEVPVDAPENEQDQSPQQE